VGEAVGGYESAVERHQRGVISSFVEAVEHRFEI
jgi:hypothetical protein